MKKAELCKKISEFINHQAEKSALLFYNRDRMLSAMYNHAEGVFNDFCCFLKSVKYEVRDFYFNLSLTS